MENATITQLLVTNSHGRPNAIFNYISFVQEHRFVLTYLWTVGINLGVFFAFYKYRRDTIFLHFLITFSISLVTVLLTFPIILQTNIPHQPSQRRTHMVVGYLLVGAYFLQVVMGCLCKLLNLCKIPSVFLFYFNKTHAVLGYLFSILSKFQVYYYIEDNHVFWILLAQDLLFFFVVIFRKTLIPNLESIGQPLLDKQQLNIKKIRSLTQLNKPQSLRPEQQQQPSEPKDYCIFANYVYDMSPLKLTHPAGYQILQSVKNREIDRFIYGMFRAQKHPYLPASSHTSKSLQLLGKPVAQIDIANPFEGMPAQRFEVSIDAIHSICYKTRIYQIDLAYKDPIKFKGYTSLEQLGRFYSLTCNRVTRLYTSVNFLTYANIMLLRKLGIDYNITPNRSIQNVHSQGSPNTQRRIAQTKINECIPLLIKVYDHGTLPNMLISDRPQNIILSPPKGLGLGLNDLQKGTILIVAGGTGLYPFSDLIDLLYKNYKRQIFPQLQSQIVGNSPILKTGALEKFKFRLLLATQCLKAIHPITLQQIVQIGHQVSFSSLNKIKYSPELKDYKLQLTNQKFEDIIEAEMSQTKDLVKIWLCGPPKMCENIMQFFGKTNKNEELLLLV